MEITRLDSSKEKQNLGAPDSNDFSMNINTIDIFSQNKYTKKMKTEYHKADINDVFGFYVTGFKLPENVKVIRYDAIYDPRQGKVVFELVTDEINADLAAKSK